MIEKKGERKNYIRMGRRGNGELGKEREKLRMQCRMKIEFLFESKTKGDK